MFSLGSEICIHNIYIIITYTLWCLNGYLNVCMHTHILYIYIYMVKITSTRPPERATKDVAEPDRSSNVFPGLQFSGAV